MTNLPIPALQNLLAKEKAAFTLPKELRQQPPPVDLSIQLPIVSSSDSESDSIGSNRKRVAKGAMPALSSSSNSNSEDDEQQTRPSIDRRLSPASVKSTDLTSKSTRTDILQALQNSNQRAIKVIVVADVVCPWCYVALRSIKLAIQDLTLSCLGSNQNLIPPKFDIEFRPFFINDNFGSDEIAIDRRAFLEAKFGHKLEEHDRIVRERGKALGIDFKLGGMLRQTTRAHRLLALAYRTGGSALQLALLEHLFHATHVEEKDIGNVELLAYYADKVGLLPKATAERWLRTRDLETDVRRLVKISVQGCGIAGVPFVVINGKWAIGGGEERSVYYKVFEKVWRGSMQ